MKTISATAALVLILAGCATTRPPLNAPTVSAARTAVDSATVCTRKATGNVARAKIALQTAALAAGRIAVTAPPAQRPDVVALRSALDTTREALDSTDSELTAATAALEDSGSRLDQLQQRIDSMAAQLGQARTAEGAAESREAFWRASTWKLALLSLALGIWTFRKPLLALVSFA